MKAASFTLLLLSLLSCKSTQKCDAYSIRGYDHIQVLGYTDTVPTFGEEQLHLPPGEYIGTRLYAVFICGLLTTKYK